MFTLVLGHVRVMLGSFMVHFWVMFLFFCNFCVSFGSLLEHLLFILESLFLTVLGHF
jgi:hypothetical protein